MFLRDKDAEKKCMDTGVGTSGGRVNWEIGIDMFILLLLCIKYITDENLLCSSRNSTQCSVVN